MDRTPRYAPNHILVFGQGYVLQTPVTKFVAYPPECHPVGCPLIPNCVALELQTNFGSRWFGCEKAYINSELRMVVVGVDERDEVRMKWEVCDTI